MRPSSRWAGRAATRRRESERDGRESHEPSREHRPCAEPQRRGRHRCILYIPPYHNPVVQHSWMRVYGPTR